MFLVFSFSALPCAIGNAVLQVRDYHHDPEGAKTRSDEQAQLAADQEAMQQSLTQWCRVGYGEVSLQGPGSCLLKAHLQWSLLLEREAIFRHLTCGRRP